MHLCAFGQISITVEPSGLCFIFFSPKELKAWHRPQIECLAAADLIAFETIPSIKEAEALVELLREFPNSKAWLSFSCKVNHCYRTEKLVWIHCWHLGAKRTAALYRVESVYRTAARSLTQSRLLIDHSSWSL